VNIPPFKRCQARAWHRNKETAGNRKGDFWTGAGMYVSGSGTLEMNIRPAKGRRA
jgi:hypothetical protein